MNPFLFKLLIFLLLSSFLFPLAVNGLEIENPLKYEKFEDLIGAIIDFIFVVALAIAPLMIIIAAFYLITAGGDPKQVETAKSIITYTLIGLAIVFLAKGLTSMIERVIGGG